MSVKRGRFAYFALKLTLTGLRRPPGRTGARPSAVGPAKEPCKKAQHLHDSETGRGPGWWGLCDRLNRWLTYATNNGWLNYGEGVFGR